MADWRITWPKLLRLEGGYVNDPHDHGGPTNEGITLAEAIRCHLDLNGDGKVDAADVRLINPAVSEPYYLREWWTPLRCGEIDSQIVADNLLLTAVCCGPRRASALLQLAARACGASLAIDGAIGPRTIAAVNALDAEKLNAAFAAQIEDYYRRCAEEPGQSRFLDGWLSRIQR